MRIIFQDNGTVEILDDEHVIERLEGIDTSDITVEEYKVNKENLFTLYELALVRPELGIAAKYARLKEEYLRRWNFVH